MDYREMLQDSIKRMHEEFAAAPVGFTKHGVIELSGEQRNVFCKCDGVEWNSNLHSVENVPFVACECTLFPWVFNEKDREPKFAVGNRVKIISEFNEQHGISNPPKKKAAVGNFAKVTELTLEGTEYLYVVTMDDEEKKRWTFAAENLERV